MKSFFTLQIAKESLSALPTTLHPKLKKLKATATVQCKPESHQLVTEFFVSIPTSLIPQIKWHTFDNQKITRQDFLWEDTCLELFMGDIQTSEYVEINVSPQGQFAFYHFDDYRQPNQMPPRKLAIEHHPNSYANITWLPNLDVYKRSFVIELTQLPIHLQIPTLINPTLIFSFYYKGKLIPLFFACKHATPADFHDQAFWQTISPYLKT